MSDDDPFVTLGLPVRPDISDDEVRAAWRRIAAATHPDLPDGGDPVRFAAAAAAYTALRTAFGRGETYADLRETRAQLRSRSAVPVPGRGPGPGARVAGPGALLVWRVCNGRPTMLALRLLIAATVCAACVAVAGWQPTTVAILVGVLTWLIRTTRYDLARPPDPHRGPPDPHRGD
jgi:hypothetical protein